MKNKKFQFDSKISSLIIGISCISVLLLVIYFGVSITSKGTFTLEDEIKYYCSDGRESQFNGNEGCCPTAGLPNWQISNLCVSPYFSIGFALPELDQGKCMVSETYEVDGVNVCEALGYRAAPNDTLDGCVFDCWEYGQSPVRCTINGVEGDLDNNGICHSREPEPVCTYGMLGFDSSHNVIGVVGNNTADECCPEGYTKFSDNECVATMDTVNHRYRSWPGDIKCYNIGEDNYELNGEWCVLVNNQCSATDYEYQTIYPARDSNVTLTLKNGCTVCPDGPDDWTLDGNTCKSTLNKKTITGGYTYYFRNGSMPCPTDQGYSMSATFDGIPICQKSITCSFGLLSSNQNRTKVIGNVQVDGGEDASACCPDGWSNSNDDECETEIDTTNHRYRAWAGGVKCINVGGDTYKLSGQWCVLEDPNEGWETKSGERCDTESNEIVTLTRCQVFAPNTDCTDSRNANLICETTGGTSVKRCSLKEDLNFCRKACYQCTANSTTPSVEYIDKDANCQSGWSTTEPDTCAKSCHYCSNGTRMTDNNVPKEKACSAYNSSYHEISENIDCTPSTPQKKTCYRCVAGSTTPEEQQMDSCTGEWSQTKPTCSKSCHYCSNGTRMTDNNVPKEKDCSAYHTGYHETSENIDCTQSTEKKNCYKCNANSTTPDTQQVDKDANCPSGWSISVPTCSKSCHYCSNGTRMTDNNVPKGKNCSAYRDGYHETSENIDCTQSAGKKNCYKCNANSTTPDIQQVDKDANCPSSWVEAVPTCSKSCNYCSNGAMLTNHDVPKLKSCSDYNGIYHETSEALNCNSDKKTCYKCNNGSTTPESQEVNSDANCPSGWSTTVPTCSKPCSYCSNGTKMIDNNVPKGLACSDYDDDYHETNEALDCTNQGGGTPLPDDPVTEIDCCECNGSTKVTKGKSTNGVCPTNQTVCSKLTCSNGEIENPQTGSKAIVIAWIIGFIAIGYSFYYFRRTNKE